MNRRSRADGNPSPPWNRSPRNSQHPNYPPVPVEPRQTFAPTPQLSTIIVVPVETDLCLTPCAPACILHQSCPSPNPANHSSDVLRRRQRHEVHLSSHPTPRPLDTTSTSVLLSRVTSPNSSLLTIHYPLSTIHYETPLSHFVPPCPTPDTNRGTPPVPFFGKVSHRPDRNGTLWDAMRHLTRKSTAPRPNRPPHAPTIHYPTTEW